MTPSILKRTVAVLLVCAALNAQADEPTAGPNIRVALNIKAQPVREALQAFGEQTGLQVLFRSEGVQVEGVKAAPVSGEMAAGEALGKMLAKTGLKHEFVNDRTVRVAKDEGGQPPQKSSEAEETEKAEKESSRPLEDARAQGESSRTGEQGARSGTSSSQPEKLDEVVVTARRREERLQDVPDAITAFSAATIENAGIERVQDYMAMTPNLVFRDGSAYRSGYAFISMRGVGTGQQGWAPVTVLVDGVQASSIDAIVEGALVDIEQIEVLRGPQSALYGAGAIAGAINITTKAPTNDFESALKVGYGKGDDKRFDGMTSGPIVPDKLLYRLTAHYEDSNGLIESLSGDHLDPLEDLTLRGRLLFRPIESLRLDLQAEYTDVTAGAIYQDRLTSPALIETFDTLETRPRRGILGSDDRTFNKYALKVEWKLPAVTLVSVSGYTNLDQFVYGSATYDDPDVPGGVAGLFGPAFGVNAAPGQTIDQYQGSVDDFETFTQDLRLASSGSKAIQWLIGASYLRRNAFDTVDVGLLSAPAPGTKVPLFTRFDKRLDVWKGVYGQVVFGFTPRLALTLAARYDDIDSKTTRFSAADRNTIIPVPDPSGTLVDTLRVPDNKFQPKVQLSYKFTNDLMGYVTAARGFRAGFFNTGNYALPETTDNYEAGIKSAWLNGTLIINASAFHIDYSNQQFSFLITTPPYRRTTNIPSTSINGVELESTWRAMQQWDIGLGVGYLDAEVANGTRSPAAPKWTVNLFTGKTWAITNGWDVVARIDYRYQDSMFLGLNDTSEIGSKDFLNARLGLQSDRWKLTTFVKNAFDTRQAATAVTTLLPTAYIRNPNKPRNYGVELAYRF